MEQLNEIQVNYKLKILYQKQCQTHYNMGTLYLKKWNPKLELHVRMTQIQECDTKGLTVKTYMIIANAQYQLNICEKALYKFLVIILMVETHKGVIKLKCIIKQSKTYTKELNKDNTSQQNKDQVQQQQQQQQQQQSQAINFHNHASKIKNFIKCIQDLLNCPVIEVEVIKKQSNQVDILLQQPQDLPIEINLKDDKHQVIQSSNIYQIKGQEENNISQSEQMIYLQRIIKRFQKKADLINIQLEILEILLQYLINPSNTLEQDQVDEFYWKFKFNLDSFIILADKFDSVMKLLKSKNYKIKRQNQKKINLISQYKIIQFYITI